MMLRRPLASITFLRFGLNQLLSMMLRRPLASTTSLYKNEKSWATQSVTQPRVTNS